MQVNSPFFQEFLQWFDVNFPERFSFDTHAQLIVFEDKRLAFLPVPNNSEELHIAYECQIIRIYQDQWENNKEILQARIRVKLGNFQKINARHCFVKRIEKEFSKPFLDENHLMGNCSSKFQYGLFLKKNYVGKFLGGNFSENDTLVGLCTFTSARTMLEAGRENNRSYELIRFASLRNYQVIGGFTKMLKYFELDQNPDEIMTYLDGDWTNGKMFEQHGFINTGLTLNRFFYFEGNKRIFVHKEFQIEKLIHTITSLKMLKFY